LTEPDWRDLPFCYLTTRGRRTGRPHTIEIWFAAGDGVVYMLSGGGRRSDWVRNILSNEEVSLRIGEETRTTKARIVAEPDEDRTARHSVAEKYRRRGEADLDEWERTALPVVVDWSG
jgi:deazaflavin-dependent oxidoreductase (nitroreductase family)